MNPDFKRLLKPLKSKSFFLFGARSTGKSTFLKNLFSSYDTLWIDLLNPVYERELRQNPERLVQMINGVKKKPEWIVIDEIQKNPRLLDLVHALIESQKLRFALTGSNARKLKHGNSNLLAGRAFVNDMHPFTHLELGKHFNLNQILNWGSLPPLQQMTSDLEKSEFLKSYAHTYLREEIQMEQVLRKTEPFRHFLEIAAQTGGEILNYSNLARDVGVDVKTAQSYFEVLEDTLIGFRLLPFNKSLRKQIRQNPKFYFFDVGVQRALAWRLEENLVPGTYAFGKIFEQFVILEFIRLNSLLRKNLRFSYIRSSKDEEIDLVIEAPHNKTILVEIKSSNKVDEADCKILQEWTTEFKNPSAYCLSLDPIRKKIGSVLCLPWQDGLSEILNYELNDLELQKSQQTFIS